MELQLYGKQILLYRQPIDFRCSIDGLLGIIVDELKASSQESLYLFYNRGKDKLKCLSWHRNGYLLFYKRLERGRFSFQHRPDNKTMSVTSDELGWLLAGLEWQTMREWQNLNYDKFS